jgi:hypothetical protein
MTGDTMKWTGALTVEKFDEEQTADAITRTGLARPTAADFAALGMAPREVVESGPNLITTNGLNRVMNLLIGTGQAASNTAARIGVGDGSTAASASDVDLAASAGSTHRYFMTMDATYPQVSGAVATFKATFASADGNFAWAEWCIDIGTPTVSAGTTVNALMLNRKVASNGTKSSGTSWVATATITLS